MFDSSFSSVDAVLELSDKELLLSLVLLSLLVNISTILDGDFLDRLCFFLDLFFELDFVSLADILSAILRLFGGFNNLL